MSAKKVLLIVNPVSGTLGSRSAIYDILDVFCKEGWMVTTVLTQRRGHAIEQASSAKENGFDMVVCCGGDGTLNETITGLLSKPGAALPLGYIPAGSTNDFAQTLGISDKPELAAQAITHDYGMTIDVGRFNGKRCFSYIASFGAFTQASYSAPQELKNVIGHLAYLLEGIKDITSLKPYMVSVESKEKSCSGKYIFGSVSNTRSVGGIVKLREEGIDLDDGLFEVILVKYPEKPLDLNKIIQGVLSSDFSSDMFDFFKSSDVKFHFETPLRWTLDGEKSEGGTDVEITNLHRAIQLVK